MLVKSHSFLWLIQEIFLCYYDSWHSKFNSIFKEFQIRLIFANCLAEKAKNNDRKS